MSRIQWRSSQRRGMQAVAVGALLALGCSHDSTRPVTRPLVPSLAIVSSPQLVAASSSTESGSAADAGESVVYVSMKPGFQLTGRSVSIRNANIDAPPVSTPMANGGFDPIAVPARVADTLLLYTADDHGVTTVGYAVVAPSKSPIVVRTEPATNVTNVTVTSALTIVFDEPMDTVSLHSSLWLLSDTTRVPTSTSLSLTGRGAIQAQLHSLAPLDSGITYTLVIASTAHNLAGSALSEPVEIPFTTTWASVRSADGLTVESFAMIEFLADGQYYYAPQITATETSGKDPIQVTGFTLDSMTNFPIMRIDFCSTSITIPAGGTRELFHESYGDYPLEYYWPGHRAQPGTAFARLTYHSADGHSHKLPIVGNITPGALPNTYTGGDGFWEDCRGT